MTAATFAKAVTAAGLVLAAAVILIFWYDTRVPKRKVTGTLPPGHPEADSVLDDDERDRLQAIDNELWGGRQ